MCQSRAQGGRRCSYHMGASRATRALAVHASGLTGAQVTSVFNNLRTLGSRELAPTPQRYEQWLNRQVILVNNTDFEGRSGMAARRALRVATDENLPDGPTFFALRRVVAESRSASRNLRHEITETGRRAGMNRNESRAFFNSQFENPPAAYEVNAERLEVAGIPRDTATASAYDALCRAAEVNESNGARVELTRRIAREPVSVNSPISEMGYDPEDGRLEIVIQSAEESTDGSPEQVVHAYRNVSPETWDRLNTSQRPMRTLNSAVRSNPDHLYETQAQADDDAHRRRCATCGRFRAMTHTCEVGSGRTEEGSARTRRSSDSASSASSESSAPEGVDASVPDWRRRLSRRWARDPDSRGDVEDMTTRLTTSVGSAGTSAYPRVREANPILSNMTLNSTSADYAVRAAVNRGALVRTNLSFTSGTNTVTSQLETWRTEEGWEARVRERQCDCPAYVSNGHCEHVTMLDDNAGTIIRAAVDSEQWQEDLRSASARTEQNRIVTLTAGSNRSMRSERFTTGVPEDVTHVPHQTGDTILAPRATDLRAAMNFGDVRCEVSWQRPDNYYDNNGFNVTGNVTMRRGMDGSVEVTERQLRCTCQNYRRNSHCEHVDYVGNQSGRLAAFGNNSAPAVVGQVHTAQALERQADAANIERRERVRAAFAAVAPEDLYTNNYAALQADMSMAQERFQRDPSTAVPFMTENATGGICSPDGGRAFGVELEFDFPGEMSYTQKREALSAIGRDLHSAGLTTASHQTGYHSAARSGYQAWSFEEDATVAGELVSPIMHDTPEHWQQLNQACEIIRRHGGVASERAGSHVHVSTGSYGRSVDRHAELSRMTSRYEDIMYRVSSDPVRGTHRPSEWCAPYHVEDRYISAARQREGSISSYFGSSHNYGMNYAATGTGNASRDNVEFRQWDATLDPGIIQAQVKISAAMVEAAERNVEVNGLSPSTRESYGTNRTNRTADDANGTARFREMLDTMFHRREDKAQAAALFGVTSWQSESRRQSNGWF